MSRVHENYYAHDSYTQQKWPDYYTYESRKKQNKPIYIQ